MKKQNYKYFFDMELTEMQNLLDKELDERWDNGILDQARLDTINEMDLHSI